MGAQQAQLKVAQMQLDLALLQNKLAQQPGVSPVTKHLTHLGLDLAKKQMECQQQAKKK